MNVKFHKITSYTWNFQNFTCVFTILVKFDIHFLRLTWEIFFGVTTDDLLHLLHRTLQGEVQIKENELSVWKFLTSLKTSNQFEKFKLV